jgi:eukaryotic-like serine/threonine-protein kinase
VPEGRFDGDEMSTTGELLDGRYRLGTLLGRGGMSDVFRAVDEVNSTDVAIKIVRSPDREYAQRLAQEAQALRRFSHPGLVQLYESGVNGDMAYLVMEFVDGPSLDQLLRQGPLTTAETAALGSSLADALAYAHTQGVVHRDVKPANVLLGPDGLARLTDFGIARLVDESTLTLTGTMLGTATYMAPEQLENHAVGPSADVFSLGIVLLECLTGERVYSGTPSEVLARRLAGPVSVPDSLPVPWKLLLAGMLAPAPEDRLSALDVSTMLVAPAFRAPWVRSTPASDVTTVVGDAARLRGGQDGATSITPPRDAPLPSRSTAHDPNRVRNNWLIVAAVVLVIAAGIGLAFALTSKPHVVTTTTVPTTTTTVPPTTTTLPSTSHSLAKLVNDVVAGQSAHSIGPQVAQSISSGAQQAVTDFSSGNLSSAANDLQGVATTIANGLANGYLTPTYAALLQSDLKTLANTLGLGAAATPSSSTTTTSTTSTTLPGPGNGNGNGNGNGPP